MVVTVFTALNVVAVLVGLVAAVRQPPWWARTGMGLVDVLVCGAVGFLPLVSVSLASPAT